MLAVPICTATCTANVLVPRMPLPSVLLLGRLRVCTALSSLPPPAAVSDLLGAGRSVCALPRGQHSRRPDVCQLGGSRLSIDSPLRPPVPGLGLAGRAAAVCGLCCRGISHRASASSAVRRRRRRRLAAGQGAAAGLWQWRAELERPPPQSLCVRSCSSAERVIRVVPRS